MIPTKRQFQQIDAHESRRRQVRNLSRLTPQTERMGIVECLMVALGVLAITVFVPTVAGWIGL